MILLVAMVDILGREIVRHVNERLESEIQPVLFDGSSLPSVIYYYCLRAGDTERVSRMVYAK